MLEVISGGRDIRPIEKIILMKNERNLRTDDEIYEFVNAYTKYYDYISSLPDDSDTILFVMDEWK